MTPQLPPFSVLGPLRASPGVARLYRDDKTKRRLAITGVKAYVRSAPTVSGVEVGVNVNGRRIGGAEIGPGAVAGRSPVDEYALGQSDYLTVDVDEIGIGEPGKDLVVVIQVGRLSFWQWLKKRIAQVFR